MSFERLIEVTQEAGLSVTNHSIQAKRYEVWRQLNDALWHRIVNHPTMEPVQDGKVTWQHGSIQLFKAVQRSLWQKLRKSEIENVIHDPGGREMQPQGHKGHVYIMWDQDSDVRFTDETSKRMGESADWESLGSSLVLIHRGVPQIIEDPCVNYLPKTNDLLTTEDMYKLMRKSVDKIFAKLLRADTSHNPHGANALFTLQQFWESQVGFATLSGNQIDRIERETDPKQAWVVIIPPSHRLMQEKPAQFSVDVAHDLNLLYIKPIATSSEWAGIAGVHELIHLHNFATGLEPKHPSRQEYIDGEFRAFSAEMLAADLTTNGEFSQAAIQSVMQRNLSISDLLQIARNPNNQHTLEQVGASIDAHLQMPKPHSFYEADTRMALYLMASAFALAQAQATKEGTDSSVHCKHFIEEIYAMQGSLPAA